MEASSSNGGGDISGSVNCPKCGKEIMSVNMHKSEGGHVLKARLVFFDEAKQAVIGQCVRCKTPVPIPVKISLK